jgi:hypothetical protein
VHLTSSWVTISAPWSRCTYSFDDLFSHAEHIATPRHVTEVTRRLCVARGDAVAGMGIAHTGNWKATVLYWFERITHAGGSREQ